MKWKRKFPKNSGIKAPNGEDVLTELSAKEFKDWIAQFGINIQIVPKDILNGMDLYTGFYDEISKYKHRAYYIIFAETKGKHIPKNKKLWNKFLNKVVKYGK